MSIILQSLNFKRSGKKYMKKNKWGRILFTSSIGVKFGGGEKTFAYSFSKYANEFSIIFKEQTKYNILYNCLRIGVTKTKIHKLVKNKNMKKRVQLIPLKRAAKPVEIADYIYFLTSNKNQANFKSNFKYIWWRIILYKLPNEYKI